MEMSEIKWNEQGLVPAIAQDIHSKKVLMLAYMNPEALIMTIETKKAHYYSRSRKSLWLKGETSGHLQHVEQICYDCDKDAILLQVTQIGAACHTGRKSCFYRDIDGVEINEAADGEGHILDEVYDVIVNRRDNPKEGSYTNYLFDKGIDKMLKKVGEETSEVIIAAKNEKADEITYEVADLMYHLSVMMVQSGVSWDNVFNELKKRR